MLEIEVIERGRGKASRFGFVVPTDGSVDAWIDQDGGARRCEVKTQTRREGVHLELECGGRGYQSLHVRAQRVLPLGKRTSIAEVTRTSGANTKVFVTQRK